MELSDVRRAAQYLYDKINDTEAAKIRANDLKDLVKDVDKENSSIEVYRLKLIVDALLGDYKIKKLAPLVSDLVGEDVEISSSGSSTNSGNSSSSGSFIVSDSEEVVADTVEEEDEASAEESEDSEDRTTRYYKQCVAHTNWLLEKLEVSTIVVVHFQSLCILWEN